MKVLIAIDAFKGSITSQEGSRAISLGIREVCKDAEIVTVPLADGGEGTVEALVQATNGQYYEKEVTGPLGNPVKAVYGILGDRKTAVIEVASACGLPLVPADQRDPLRTTSYGVGELIADAMDKGCRSFVIGLGGSSTNDAGIGMLQALGFRFLDEKGEEVGWGGQALRHIRRIDSTRAHRTLQECRFHAACDVHNPLYGPNGAAYVFAPQKGAAPEIVRELDEGLRNFAEIVRRERSLDIDAIPGAGAAGGLGAAFAGFLGARLESGIQLILDLIGMEQKMQDVDFVITGEGKLDDQTSMGKAPMGVVRLAQKHRIPVIALAGTVVHKASLNETGITSYFSILNKPMTLAEAMDGRVAFDNLRSCTNQLFRLIQAIRCRKTR